MATWEERERKRRFGRCTISFKEKVNPMQLLPYLECFTKSTKEQIERWVDRYGAEDAAWRMSQELVKMDDWYEDIIHALRETNHDALADRISGIDRHEGDRGIGGGGGGPDGGGGGRDGGEGRDNGRGGRDNDRRGRDGRGGRDNDREGRDGRGGRDNDRGGRDGRGGWDGGRGEEGRGRGKVGRDDVEERERSERGGHKANIDGRLNDKTAVAISNPNPHNRRTPIPLSTPIKHAPFGVISIVSSMLNVTGAIRNWKTLAGLLGMTFSEVQPIEREQDPTVKVIDWWKETRHDDATLGALLKTLDKMERKDIVDMLRTDFNIEQDVPEEVSPLNPDNHKAKGISEPEACYSPTSVQPHKVITMAKESQDALGAQPEEVSPLNPDNHTAKGTSEPEACYSPTSVQPHKVITMAKESQDALGAQEVASEDNSYNHVLEDNMQEKELSPPITSDRHQKACDNTEVNLDQRSHVAGDVKNEAVKSKMIFPKKINVVESNTDNNVNGNSGTSKASKSIGSEAGETNRSENRPHNVKTAMENMTVIPNSVLYKTSESVGQSAVYSIRHPERNRYIGPYVKADPLSSCSLIANAPVFGQQGNPDDHIVVLEISASSTRGSSPGRRDTQGAAQPLPGIEASDDESSDDEHPQQAANYAYTNRVRKLEILGEIQQPELQAVDSKKQMNTLQSLMQLKQYQPHNPRDGVKTNDLQNRKAPVNFPMQYTNPIQTHTAYQPHGNTSGSRIGNPANVATNQPLANLPFAVPVQRSAVTTATTQQSPIPLSKNASKSGTTPGAADLFLNTDKSCSSPSVNTTQMHINPILRSESASSATAEGDALHQMLSSSAATTESVDKSRSVPTAKTMQTHTSPITHSQSASSATGAALHQPQMPISSDMVTETNSPLESSGREINALQSAAANQLESRSVVECQESGDVEETNPTQDVVDTQRQNDVEESNPTQDCADTTHSHLTMMISMTASVAEKLANTKLWWN